MKTKDEIIDKNPFKVPENYFENANRRIISSTVEAGPVIRKKGISRSLRLTLAVAASVAVFVMLGYTAFRLFNPENKNLWLSEISTEELAGSYLDDIDLLTLEENTDLSAMYDSEPITDKEDIIDYLLSENIDLNEIYEIL
jgi:hypothetical protein